MVGIEMRLAQHISCGSYVKGPTYLFEEFDSYTLRPLTMPPWRLRACLLLSAVQSRPRTRCLAKQCTSFKAAFENANQLARARR